MLEVTTSWTIPSGIATKSVMYFADGSDLATCRERIWGSFNGFMDSIASGVSFSVDPEARVLNPATGVLLGLVSDATPRTASGTGAARPVADATQVLLRWFTGQVIGGRFVQGRTYIPGLDANLLTGGNLSSGAQADFAAGALAVITPSVGFGVWHRPKNGAGGQLVQCTSVGVNAELAVLRRRRNR